LPSVTVARSAFAHDAASDVDESEDEHPVSVNAVANTTAAKIPLFLFLKFNLFSPYGWGEMDTCEGY
jgi:hypothetical protein